MGSWNITIEEYGPRVWNIVYRIVGNQADASDCFQEVFLTAVKSSRKRKIRNIEAFLSLLATQRAIDWIRKKNRKLQINTTSMDCETLKSSMPTPFQNAQSMELAEELRMALSKIPPLEAQVFCLRILNELSYRQIAEEINVHENYVGVLINRARSKLRNILKLVTVENGREVAHD
ncbi:MAG: sigma-70 family RNA polymerase sigma factor [Deltaproteobacteria bacterium]|nr:sigma-70 family RNA polymerase sigma factor [Deltaproteobacteria bacterium]